MEIIDLPGLDEEFEPTVVVEPAVDVVVVGDQGPIAVVHPQDGVERAARVLRQPDRHQAVGRRDIAIGIVIEDRVHDAGHAGGAIGVDGQVRGPWIRIV